MITITTELLAKEPNLQDFSCGVDAVDNMVNRAYFQHILLKTRVYRILYRGYAVGYYQLSFQNIYLARSDIEFADWGDDGGWYGLLSVDFLAIQKEVQHQGIGTLVLNEIIKESQQLREKWPIRMIKIDALCDKVPWYLKNGFDYLFENEKDQDYGTVKMYFELMTEKENQRVKEYCDLLME